MEQHHTGYGSVTPNYGYGKDEGYGSYLSPGPPVPSSYGNDTGNTYTGRYDTFASGYDQPAPTYRPTGSYGAVGEPVKPAGYVSGEFTSQSQERSWQDYDNYGSNTQDYGRDIGNGYDRQVGYSNFSTQENYQQESAPPSYELGQGFNNNRGRPSFSSNQERGSMQHDRGGFDGTDGYTRGGRGAVRGRGRGHYGYEGQFEDVNTGGGQFDSGSSRGRGSRGGHGGIGAGGGDFNSGNRGRGLFDDGNRGRSEFGGDTSGRGQFGGDTWGRPGQFGKDIRGRGQFGRGTRGRGQFGGDTRGRGQFGGLNRGASSGGRGSFGGGQSDRDREQFRGGSRGRGQFVSGNRGRGLFDVNRGRGQVGNTRGRGWVQSGSPRLGQDVSRGTGQYGARGNKQTGNRGRGQQVGVQLGLQEGATRGGLVSRGRGRGDGGGFSTPATKATKPFKMSSADAQGFISYKNNLQEYAQKSHKPIPQYTSQKADIGFAATVSIDGQMYSSLQSQREKKDAEQSAAFEALKALGYIDANDMFSPKLGTSKAKKRPSEDGDVPTPNAKVAKQEQPAPGQAAGSAPGPPPMSYKSKLNERIMKMRLDLPTYNTVRTAGGFMSTLVLNGQVYQGVKACGTKKLAEQHVAEIVFTQLDFKVEATPGEAIVVVGSGSDAALSTPEAQKELSATTSTSSKPPSAPKAKPMKNIVQEYCQKNGMQIPIYSSVKDAGMFIATVTVNGVEYVGTPHIMKKTAEQNAAKKVCEELGLKF